MRLGHRHELTHTQEQLGHELTERLRIADEQRLFILVEGLSGVGKSTLLNSLDETISQFGGKIFMASYDVPRILSGRIKQDELEATKRSAIHFVGTTIPFSLERGLSNIKKNFSEFEVVQMILPGMSQKEIRPIVRELKGENCFLTEEQIISFSMGVPHLSKFLANGVTRQEDAARISSEYLHANMLGNRRRPSVKYLKESEMNQMKDLGEITSKYLKIPPNRETLSVYNKIVPKERRIYSDLVHALQVREELIRAGVFEESPLFVCPESEHIYDQMIYSNDIENTIEVYAPSLNENDFQRLCQAVGLERIDFQFDFPLYRYGDVSIRYNLGTRPKMFKCDERKVGFLIKHEKFDIVLGLYHGGWERRFFQSVEAYEKVIQNQGVSRPKTNIDFFVHCHDHEGLFHNPTRTGWMFESFFQQRKIQYFAKNTLYGANYIYKPEENRMKFVEEIDYDSHLKF